MDDRLYLHEKLCEILGSRNVYFNPSESVKISYPSIIYSLSAIKNSLADNIKYSSRKRYLVILVDKNPDSIYVNKINEITLGFFDRSYTVNNLYHFAFYVYV